MSESTLWRYGLRSERFQDLERQLLGDTHPFGGGEVWFIEHGGNNTFT